jgi:DNA-binding response OmpR family regulator
LEDQEDHQFVMQGCLGSAFRLEFFGTLHELHDRLQHAPLPDLLIADLGLPDGNFISSWLDGEMRSLEEADIPFLVVSAWEDTETIGKALQIGARDFLLKPFSPKELQAKVRHSLILQKLRQLALTATEERIFKTLFTQAPLPVAREALEKRVWGADSSSSKSLDVHLCRLRKKLGQLDPPIALETKDSGWSLRTDF